MRSNHFTGNGSQATQPNGNGAAVHAFEETLRDDAPPKRAKGGVIDVILRMHSDLVEYGQNRALVSGDVEPRPSDLRVLEEHAEAMAEEAYRDAYDPSKHEDHKLREAEYQKLTVDREEAELRVNYAAADVAELEESMAKVQSNMTAPGKPQVLMVSAVAGLALTIAPTLHDYVFITMKDDVLNWAISLLSAATYGVFITWGLLDSDDLGGRRSARNWLGLAGGIGVPIGLGMLRVANAVDRVELLFAVALTVVEIGIVLLLESRAVTLRVAYQEWAAQHATVKDISARLEAARAHHARRKQMLAEINDAISTHIRHVEELSIRNFNIEKIRLDALKAVRDGYYAGVAANRGRSRGIRRGIK